MASCSQPYLELSIEIKEQTLIVNINVGWKLTAFMLDLSPSLFAEVVLPAKGVSKRRPVVVAPEMRSQPLSRVPWSPLAACTHAALAEMEVKCRARGGGLRSRALSPPTATTDTLCASRERSPDGSFHSLFKFSSGAV